MIHWSASLQPLFIGVILLASGAVKLGPAARRTAARSALRALVGERRALPAYRTVGTAELVVAAALLLPPAHPAETVAAAVLAAGFLGYLGYARVVAPDASCGCLSTRSAPVTWRAFCRAGMLLAAGALSTGAALLEARDALVPEPRGGVGPAAGGGADFWTGAFTARPLPAAGVLLAEVMVVLALSAEADRAWLLPLRRLRIRLRHPLTGWSYDVPLEATVQQLHHSEAYRATGGLLRSGLRESWDEEDIRLLCYTAEYDGRPATAVFAVPRLYYRPADIRVAFVDEATQTTLMRVSDTTPTRVSDTPPPTEDQLSARTMSTARARSSG